MNIFAKLFGFESWKRDLEIADGRADWWKADSEYKDGLLADANLKIIELQDLVAWLKNVRKFLEKAKDKLADERNQAWLENRELREKVAALESRIRELEERLQIDPGGSDKIDELTAANSQLRAKLEALHPPSTEGGEK